MLKSVKFAAAVAANFTSISSSFSRRADFNVKVGAICRRRGKLHLQKYLGRYSSFPEITTSLFQRPSLK